MDRTQYAEIMNDTVMWSRRAKKQGDFFPCIQSHMISKIEGMLEVAMKDRDLSIEDFKWLSDFAFDKMSTIQRIICDPKRYY